MMIAYTVRLYYLKPVRCCWRLLLVTPEQVTNLFPSLLAPLLTSGEGAVQWMTKTSQSVPIRVKLIVEGGNGESKGQGNKKLINDLKKKN